MEMQTTIRAAIVAPVGAKVTDRRLNAVAQSTSIAARALIASRGGKVGKAAAMLNSADSLAAVIEHASHSNYRPLAEIIAAETGKVISIDRFAFHALPGRYADEMADLESRGKATSATTGKPSAAFSQAMYLHKLCTEVLAGAETLRAEREAEREAERKARETTLAIMQELDRIESDLTTADDEQVVEG